MTRMEPPAERVQPLKADLFGRVVRVDSSRGVRIVRDLAPARWWARPIARVLAGREARALRALHGLNGVPDLLSWNGKILERGWIEGQALQNRPMLDPRFYDALRRLLITVHRRRVTHNDLAKQPNVLVRDDGRPALVDFQLAAVHARRGRWFRLCAREDLRHLLKHKRRYCPNALTPRESAMLATPSGPARIWRATGKKVYMAWTRGVLGWSDREGAGDRGAL
jgi:RIO-like serine/threonine protein kinase